MKLIRYGVEILERTPVTALKQKGDDRWEVSTPKGDIIADKIVIAAGELIYLIEYPKQIYELKSLTPSNLSY